MIALAIGIVFIAFAVFSVLPAPYGLNWFADVLLFLRGAAPVLAVFLGLIIAFIGVADIKDKIDAKKEEEEAAAEDSDTPAADGKEN